MKKFIFTLVLAISSMFAAKAQIYSPSYAYYQGVGYFVMSNGYYYGNISGGYPQGEGYCYCIDPQLGPIYYHGNFDKGVVHGKGELLSSSGYICGTWNHGDFISQIDVPSYQMQQSYTDVWSNYFNYYAPTYSYPTYTTPNYDYSTYFNQSYYPSYSYPNYTYPSYSYPSYSYPSYNYPSYDFNFSTPSTTTNYQAKNNVKIPDNTKITQIDSDTELGRQLLGKIGR